MAALPNKDDIAGTGGSAPSNATARAGFGSLWEYLNGLFGSSGVAADARAGIGMGAGQLAGHRNKLRNATLQINQRGYVSGAALGAGLFGLDRWQGVLSTDNYTWTVSGNGTVIVTIPAGMRMMQRIPAGDLPQDTYVLSWGGTATAKLNGGVAGVSGMTMACSGTSDVIVEFLPGTVALPQFEPGTIPTPFEYRLDELDFCLPFCYLPDSAISIGYPTNLTSAVGSALRFALTHPKPMRITPTVTILSQTQVDRAGSNLGVAASSNKTHLVLEGNVAAGSGIAAWTGVRWLANAELYA